MESVARVRQRQLMLYSFPLLFRATDEDGCPSFFFRALNISIASYRNPSDELNQTYRPIVFRERKLTFTHVRYMLSPVRLSSVCCLSITLVRPTQSVEIFGNISTSLGTLAICWHSQKILRKSSPGTPPSGGLNARWVAKYSDSGHTKGYISERVQDRM